MTEQDARIEQLEKEVELLKKRVDYFYEEIRPYIMAIKSILLEKGENEKEIGYGAKLKLTEKSKKRLKNKE